jgi:hypothetical protein
MQTLVAAACPRSLLRPRQAGHEPAAIATGVGRTHFARRRLLLPLLEQRRKLVFRASGNPKRNGIS